MAKLGTIAMLTLLISGPALAGSHIDKEDVGKVLFTKSNEISAMQPNLDFDKEVDCPF